MPENALQLMRSRYTAFALGEFEYLRPRANLNRIHVVFVPNSRYRGRAIKARLGQPACVTEACIVLAVWFAPVDDRFSISVPLR